MLDELNRLIRVSQLADVQIERTAGLSNSYIYRMRSGSLPVTRNMLMRIRLAVARIRRKDNDPSGAMPAACYRLAIALVADKAGVLPSFILSADPSRRATADPIWLRAARLRRIGLYIACIYLNVPQADLARAAGMSKAAVSIALNDLEDERGQDEIEAVLLAVEGAFEG